MRPICSCWEPRVAEIVSVCTVEAERQRAVLQLVGEASWPLLVNDR